MNIFRNLSVRGKIVSTFLFVIILEVILLLVAISFLNGFNGRLNRLVDVQAEKVKLAARINRNLVEIHRAEKNLILSDTRKEMDEYAAGILEYKTDLEDRLVLLTHLADEQERSTLHQFKMDYQAFLQINSQVQALILGAPGPVMDGKSSIGDTPRAHSRAIDLSRGKGRDAYDRAAKAIRAIVEGNDAALENARAAGNRSFKTVLTLLITLSGLFIAVGLIVGLWVSRNIAAGINAMVKVADAISRGELETPIAITGTDEISRLATSVMLMQKSLKKAGEASDVQDWLKTGIVRLNEVMLGEKEIAALCTKVITEIAGYLDAKIGAFYILKEKEREPVLSLLGSYAYAKRKNLSNEFKLGEGLVGQAALEKKQILIGNVPEAYVKVTSGLGELLPRFIAVTPFLYETRVKGVVEVGFLNPVTDIQMEYLNQAMSLVGINLETIEGREEVAKALAQSQALTEELQSQQHELKALNEELEEQTQLLQQSEEKLKVQQEELEVSNEELEEKNEALERQKRDIEKSRRDIEKKAEELSIASKYKSEFLANMSHELRTPLNSLLLLASILTDNKEGNLTDDQVESLRIIYNSGNDLLLLINEILDLSRIEAGQMEVQVEEVLMKDVLEGIKDSFQHMAQDKGLSLEILTGENAPEKISTDRKRLDQVLKNLMSNAIKFTEKGSITIDFVKPARDMDLSKSGLKIENAVAIAVRDTGIGIPGDKQKVIFEAFQQIEGGTARKYGGTGLGLSISRELAALLGGEIQVKSEGGKGSVFTLFLPVDMGKSKIKTGDRKPEKKPKPLAPHNPYSAIHDAQTAKQRPMPSAISDDRDNVQPGDKTILIIEDDANFAKVLRDQCHQKGFKCLAGATGESGFELARNHIPDAVILDIRLPGIDGWTVLEMLKENPETRHIPVHIMSVEDATLDAFRKGAIGFLTKPAKKEELEEAFQRLEAVFSRAIKELLVVEDDENLRKSIIKLVGNGDVHAEEAGSGKETILALKSGRYDCMILDLGLPDMTGFQLLKTLEEEEIVIPPVIVYTGRELSRDEETELTHYAESIIIKGVRSQERLLDEASLFLHRMVGRLPDKQRQMITDLHDTDMMFRGKKVLVVDDDMRNVFALSRVLEEKGMNVLKAENGQRALDLLAEDSDPDLVLMDIMMPVLDGYETMKQIRAQPRFSKLPIIALTAKAMKQDRELCIAAGASDYLPKPVDINRLFSMIRVWLYR